MKKRDLIIQAATLLSLLCISANTASAKQEFYNASPYPAGIISCTSCHSSAAASEGNVSASYGLLYARYVNDDAFSTFVPAYRSIEKIDSDGDGFTNIQEINKLSNFNNNFSTPLFLDAYTQSSGNVYALSVPNTALIDLYGTVQSPYTSVPIGQKNVGGTVEYTLNSSLATATGTVQFLFKTGGVQSGINENGITYTLPTVQFIDTYSGVSIPITASAIDADGGSWVTDSTNGSITITIADDGPFDLYSSTLGTAFYDPNATPGVIQTRIAVTSAVPTAIILSGSGGGASTGGLHCMTSGLATQGFMFVTLFTLGFLIRRKRS